MQRPLVAVCGERLVSGRVGGWDSPALGAKYNYLDGLRRGGLRPAVIAGPSDGSPDETLDGFAGLVLLGGGDLDPDTYGQVRHREVYGTDEVRDQFELGLARYAVEAGIPLFAICRGLQVLNVAFGGTLHQHVPDLGTGVAHGEPIGGGDPVTHPVYAVAGSRLAAAAGEGAVIDGCITIHHQSVDRVGTGLVVTATSTDGIVEALETPPESTGWVLAVQWHPERSASFDPGQQALFDAFAAAVPVTSPVS